MIGGVLVGAAWLVLLVPHELAETARVRPAARRASRPLRRRAGDRSGAPRSGDGLRSGALERNHRGAAGLHRLGDDHLRERRRPYDAQLVRDFHASGARDLATYAVGDTLGAALGLLVIIPVVAFALGSLVARLAAGDGGDGRAREPVSS